MKKRNSERIEIIDTTKNNVSSENLKSYFDNNGYFDSKINSKIELDPKNKNFGKVVYNIIKGNQYYLDSIKTDIKSKELDSIFELNKPKTLFKNK